MRVLAIPKFDTMSERNQKAAEQQIRDGAIYLELPPEFRLIRSRPVGDQIEVEIQERDEEERTFTRQIPNTPGIHRIRKLSRMIWW